jgi:hypothetical protein
MPAKDIIIEYVMNQFPFPKGEEFVVLYNNSSKKYLCKGWQLIYFDLASNRELFRYTFKELDGTFDPGERICVISGFGKNGFSESGQEAEFSGAHWDLFTHKSRRVMNSSRILLTLLDEESNFIDSMHVERIHPMQEVGIVNHQHLKCFLSYRFSSENETSILKLQRFLTLLNVEVITGDKYEPRGISEKVLSKLASPLDFLIIFIARDGESYWTRDEIAYARHEGLPVIPIVQDDKQFTPGIFGDLEYIPFAEGFVEGAFLKLLDALQFIRKQKTTKDWKRFVK